ncbi:hypothetical protein [Bacteroides acidifaciens]|uniref:Uncharacterized protein n=1 Tax=Bacteroides acidifaciens TaxID=85831 RepID=A0A4S2B0I2_9BACE|nr:hypothetical protein [Bacteroides acidifaciens]TGY07466.1 hypothetical protein E5356_03975 [Bacteroides acidifaciens]
MSYTATYTERKKFVKYDESHVLLYLNEQPGEVTNQETGETVPGFSYTGDQPDGGTLIEAAGVTDENRRGKFVAGLIGFHYDIDAQIATLANGKDTPEHAAELAQFSALRTQCKDEVDELLARTL